VGLRTRFTELAGIPHPIALAPMGDVAGGLLAAAVSDAGGLGLVGGGRGDPDWVDRELTAATASTDRPWGVGFQAWSTPPEVVERALAHRPDWVMLSFGDPRALAGVVAAAGVRLIVQVTDRDEALQAVDVGADVIVAQGTEAGGHSGRRSTFPFVPTVVDLVTPIPVLAAGGIADGRGVAAALALGADGVLVGSRFLASSEALATGDELEAVVSGRGEDTERSRVFDIARDVPWPSRYPARTMRNSFLERWRGRDDELRADDVARATYQDALAAGNRELAPVWASEAIDLITDVRPAADVLHALVAEAETSIARVADAVD
jgi:nitronate monooxygenase